MTRFARTPINKRPPISEGKEPNPLYGQFTRCLGRIALAIILILMIALMGGALFEPLKPLEIAKKWHEAGLLARFVPTGFLIAFIPLHDPSYARYMLAPFSALIFVILAAASYVQDIYALPRFSQALQYVFASLFGFFYPELVIDGGQMQIPEGEINVLDAIGGPGFVLIQPGNAVIFRKLRSPSRASVTRSYFMSPFEEIGHITSLDDQHGYVDKVETITSDGIKVAIQDVHFRFKVLPEEKNGKTIARSPENPYPYSEAALNNMAHNLVVTEKGPTSWHRSVQRVIVGGITQYVNAHTIDNLTAPRQDKQDPRGDIRRNLFSSATGKNLASLGAELLWVDIGHIDIIEEEVDQSRLNYWAAEWVGTANVARAFGDATRQAYQELGRAESQAAFVIGITNAFEKFDFTKSSVGNLRTLFLERTAQLLEAMQSSKQLESGE